MGARLKFHKLLLLAPAGEYPVDFHDGVNVIVGPFGTGKTSVLLLLDYACGSMRVPEYPEISKCSDVLVELSVDGELITISRSLRDVHAKARLYGGSVIDVRESRLDGIEVYPRHTPGQRSISSELLTRLGLGHLQTKVAPSQDASKASTYSIRDLFHLLYVDQDRLASTKNAFFETEPHNAIKLRAGFEIVTGLYDEAETARAAELASAEAEEKRLEQFLEDATRFLDQMKIMQAEEIDAELRSVSERLEELTKQLAAAKVSTDEHLGGSRALLDRRNRLATDRATTETQIRELERTLQQLGRLRVQYERERGQLEFLEESRSLVGSLPVFRCPNCMQPIIDGEASAPTDETGFVACYVCKHELASRPEEISFAPRLRALKARIKDLETYVAEVQEEQRTKTAHVRGREREIRDLDSTLTRLEQTTLLPQTRILVELNEAVALTAARRKQLEEHRAFRERSRGEGSNLLRVQDRIRRLREGLATAQRPSPEAVLNRVSDLLVETLRDIGFPILHGIALDARTYAPIVRDQSYAALQSHGAIALVSASWHIALLRYALEERAAFPMLLMIDSPLSHVGHDQADPEFRDQRVVEAFYRLLARLHTTCGDEFQIIVTANRPPSWVQGTGMVAVEFTRRIGVGRFGLISDEDASEALSETRP